MSAPSASASTSRARLALCFLGLAAIYLLLVARFNFLTDDAFISFRYSRNFAEGLGLRYNAGVEPPVEGYSNLLWVIWLALFEWLHMDLTVWSRLSSVVCGLVLLWRVFRLVLVRTDGLIPATIAAGFLATAPAFAAWSTSGLATMPFALFVFLAFEGLLGDSKGPRTLWTILAMAALVLIRTDGPFWVALVAGAAGLTWWPNRSKRLLRATAVSCSLAALVFVLQVAWRYGYYEDWVSNTARAKVGFSLLRLERGFNYAMSFALTYVSVPLAIEMGLIRVRRDLSGLVAPSLMMVTGFFAFAILVGGDFFCMGRFLAPCLPFCALLVGGTVEALLARPAGKPKAVLYGSILGLLSLLPGWDLHVVPLSARERFHFRWRVPEYVSEHARWETQVANSDSWTQLGRAMGMHSKPGESFVIGRIGAVGYYSNLLIHDVKGLVDGEVTRDVPADPLGSPGHERTAFLHYFADREPTYLFAQIRPHAEANKRAMRDAYWTRVSADPREMDLLRQYELERIPLHEDDGFEEGQVLCRYRRKTTAGE